MKVYLVEDHESMRIILKRLLRRNFPGISVVGESASAETALEEIPVFKPNLVLVDISLPGMDGIEMVRRLKSCYPDLCILVVTGQEVDIYRQSALEAGAHDIISKDDDAPLLESIAALQPKHTISGND
ncbi:MAG: response regulator [Chitinivibrionales bacterium]|nr:response regulator [Chitinivibrionales bacterium]MBD3357251.1 response regulator [Chitinivibrionales bacterium]